MKRVALVARICLIALVFLATYAHAQDDGVLPGGALPAGAAQNGGRSLNILEIEDADVATLRTLTTRRPDAISLGASLAAMQGDAAAWASLASWVRDGGVVFLHTDAAQLFGYRTVQAREGNPQLAGQLYGRARNALPFGAHPLLWSGASPRTELPGLAPSSRIFPELGVQVVYYQLDPGDALAVDHPAAVPLLRVTDLAAASGEPLYAAAIAPFGNGWAVFAPRFIEQNRADGASFAQNLLRLVSSVGPSPYDAPLPTGAAAAAPAPGAPSTPGVEPLVGISGSLIETLSNDAAGNGWAALLAAWQKARERIPAAFLQPAEIEKPDAAPCLLVAKSEADAVGAGLAAAAQGGDARGVQTLIYLMRARLEYQRFQNAATEQWLQAAEKIAPTAAEVLLWRGVLSAASAQNLVLSAQLRAQGFNDAAQHWSAALGATPLVRGVNNAALTSISGVPLEAIRAWIASASRAAQLMSVEPPLVSAIGNENSGLVVRHFDNDPTLRLAIPAAALLSRADSAFGWHLDAEEILIFPTDAYYTAYSSAARTPGSDMAFNPLAQHANVVGNRILMVSQITLPVLLSPGPPPIYGQLGVGVPAVLARLHAQVLINALTQDGVRAPAWMQLGLMSLANIVVVNDDPTEATSQALRNVAGAGGLLAPRQFENVNLGADQSGLAETQARSLMRYFYASFGSGAVVETLQRLGSGENIDEALQATTGMNEAQFFLTWRNGAFG
jgi:hypothetical protein